LLLFKDFNQPEDFVDKNNAEQRRRHMHGSTRRFWRSLASWALATAVCLPAGCSLSPGGRLTSFSSGNRLLGVAKEMRQEATQPVDLPRELDKQVLAPYTVEPGDVLFVTLT